mmetsp:Transcript_30821/g.64382  ORF Transcript_30821/g.64382 Transcript_30821/m.64382 type:complete len:230 (+) Transcript_30821:2435-3124(+)
MVIDFESFDSVSSRVKSKYLVLLAASKLDDSHDVYRGIRFDRFGTILAMRKASRPRDFVKASAIFRSCSIDWISAANKSHMLLKTSPITMNGLVASRSNLPLTKYPFAAMVNFFEFIAKVDLPTPPSPNMRAPLHTPSQNRLYASRNLAVSSSRPYTLSSMISLCPEPYSEMPRYREGSSIMSCKSTRTSSSDLYTSSPLNSPRLLFSKFSTRLITGCGIPMLPSRIIR